MRSQGKVAVITGVGSEIGRACAHEFARRGARVAVVDIFRSRSTTATDIGPAAIAVTACGCGATAYGGA